MAPTTRSGFPHIHNQTAVHPVPCINAAAPLQAWRDALQKHSARPPQILSSTRGISSGWMISWFQKDVGIIVGSFLQTPMPDRGS